MNLPSFQKKSFGFTLIELLVVIVVIGILAGVIIVVINPNLQQEKAKEGVIKGNVDKIGQAVIACASSTPNPHSACDTMAKVGVIDPSGSPEGSTYDVYPSASGDVSLYVLGMYTTSTGAFCTYYIKTQVEPTFLTTRTWSGCHTSW